MVDSTNLRQLRQQRGWTQEELAAMAGLTSRSVIRHKTGKSRPSQKAIDAYAHALGISEVVLARPYQVFTDIEWRSDRK